MLAKGARVAMTGDLRFESAVEGLVLVMKSVSIQIYLVSLAIRTESVIQMRL